MPELPETETIARDLDRLVSGGEVRGCTILRPDVLRRVNAASIGTKLIGRRIERTWRRAKIVVLDLNDGQRILVQPRFTGSMRVIRDCDSPTLPHECVRLALADGRALLYCDIRRLGTFSVVSEGQFSDIDSTLGIEPLDPAFTGARLSGILRSSGRFVKVVLMDQRRIAGCGNIYACEALWRAGIDPSRRADLLSGDDAQALRDALVGVLSASIEARGTTFRDFRDARGERGQFAASLEAYGRGGQPCRRCGHRMIETHAIDGRATHFCYRCQE
ncbi:MAG: Formamidopyrimidine-DNA glycosylase [Gemmatimonadaceae bacterium]|nr:Formamidopyrimidine-DNA glycosylase [Gemmatimonadaceae bacterium]